MSEKKKRSPLSFIVGLTVIILCAVGIVSIFSAISREADNRSKEKDSVRFGEYESFVAPIIMYDPDTFDDITVANTDQLISIAIWSILGSELEPDAYEYSDDGMIIPASDVESEYR